jgi:hypothetical protein
MRRQVAFYRKLLLVYPPSFRSTFGEPMTQMVIDRIDSEGSTPLFWAHLVADGLRTALHQHMRSLAESMRSKPMPYWALLLTLGAALGCVVGAVGALNGGFDGAAAGTAESSVWLLASYAIVLLAFTASVIRVGLNGSPLLGVGTILVIIGQLSVISYEAQVMNPDLQFPTLGPASAFPVMLGAGLVAAGMSGSTKWARSHMGSTALVALYPLVLVFGASPFAVEVTGSEVAADLAFKAGFMMAWLIVGGSFLLANPPNPNAPQEE